jgi:uncharacterized membrane protein
MRTNRVKAAGIVLGIGLGGFVDGIVLHMILRWRHMLSNVVPPDTMAGMHTNMTWDGLFHALTWCITLAGVFMLWNAARQQAVEELPATRSLIGAMITGWGLFNLIEGIVDHHLLALHNVKEVSNPLPWNIGFLLIGGALIIVVGWTLMQAEERRRIALKRRTA